MLRGFDEGRAIELGEGIASLPRARPQCFGKRCTKGLDGGEEEEPFTRAYGLAFDEVKASIGTLLLVAVQTIQSEHREERLTLEWTFG